MQHAVEELIPAPPPWEAFRRLAGLPHVLFLDSALRHPTLGRYSFLTADPFEFLRLGGPEQDPFAILAERLDRYRCDRSPVCRLSRAVRRGCSVTISAITSNACHGRAQ